MRSAVKWMWQKPSQLCAEGCDLEEITEVSYVNIDSLSSLSVTTELHSFISLLHFCFLIYPMKTSGGLCSILFSS